MITLDAVTICSCNRLKKVWKFQVIESSTNYVKCVKQKLNILLFKLKSVERSEALSHYNRMRQCHPTWSDMILGFIIYWNFLIQGKETFSLKYRFETFSRQNGNSCATTLWQSVVEPKLEKV